MRYLNDKGLKVRQFLLLYRRNKEIVANTIHFHREAAEEIENDWTKCLMFYF